VSLRAQSAGLILGTVVGLGAGLLIAPRFPAPPGPEVPRSLSAAFQAEYLVLAAHSYSRHLDLERAEFRLALFSEERNPETFASLAQSALAAGRPEEARALAELGAALWPRPFDPASATATAFLRGTPLQLSGTAPALLLIPTEPPPAPATYVLLAQETLCPPAGAAPLIQVVVLDALGNPLPGVEVAVEWPGGRDHFFTGLKPELGLGYGDVEMVPGVAYRVYPLPDGEVVEGLLAPPCPDAQGGAYPGSWRLTYRWP